jgi:hypothetical protein
VDRRQAFRQWRRQDLHQAPFLSSPRYWGLFSPALPCWFNNRPVFERALLCRSDPWVWTGFEPLACHRRRRIWWHTVVPVTSFWHFSALSELFPV